SSDVCSSDLGSFSTNVLVPLWALAVFLYKYSLSSGSIFYISCHSHMGKVHFDQFFYLSVHFGSLVLVFLLLFESVFRFLFLLLLFFQTLPIGKSHLQYYQ